MSDLAKSADREAAPRLLRVLGRWDLVLLMVVAVTNINIVPVVAAGGGVTIWLWLAALVCFFAPQGVAVIALSYRYPGEAGVYLWPKLILGEFHGFTSGWCYWVSNVFYVPSLLLFVVGLVVYVGGGNWLALADKPWFSITVSLGLLWLLIALNVLGLSVGKWVNNVGGIGTIIAGLALMGLALWRFGNRGSHLHAADLRIAGADWRLLSIFGMTCFALVGLELGSDMGDEIRDPRRTLPEAIWRAGLISGLLYVGGTLALLVTMPQQEIGVVQGVLQAVERMLDSQVAWVVSLLAILLSVAVSGVAAAWLEGPSRIIFVAGLDRYLPSALGKVHRRFLSPYVSLIVYGVVCTLVVAMSFVGATAREAYLTLLNLAVILGLIQYIYLYASLIRFTARNEPASNYRFNRRILMIAGIVGLAATCLGAILAFIPSRQIDSVWAFELKLFLGCALFIGVGTGFYRVNSDRGSRAEALAR